MTSNTIQSFWYDTVDSTMDEAKRLVQSGKIKDIAYVIAKSQTSGRGTRGRSWDSQADSGIYLSIVHLPKGEKFFEITTLYTQACGVACVEAIQNVCNIKTSLKPVNDIYANDKKLGGILVESKLERKGISSLITGIGINTKKVSRNLDRAPVKPISLEELMPDFKNFANEKLIETVVDRICFWYSEIFRGEQLRIKELWENYKLDF